MEPKIIEYGTFEVRIYCQNCEAVFDDYKTAEEQGREHCKNTGHMLSAKKSFAYDIQPFNYK